MLFFVAKSQAATEFELDDVELDIDLLATEELSNSAEKKWRMIFAWQNGVSANDIQDIRSHRFDTRLDWGQLVFDNYFLKFDGKLILRLPGDDNQLNQKKAEFDGRLRELYLQRSLQSWTITAGFQTITLGEMDAVQVSDLFSPWDYSEFAFTSPEDARLGQFVINAEWYSKKSRWQILYSPWPLTNRYPGGDNNQLVKQIFSDQPYTIDDMQPAPFDQHEFLVKWQKSIEGSDFALIYANLLNNDPTFTNIGKSNDPVTQFQVDYSRFTMWVASANYSAGNFLWKVESAYKQNMQFQSLDRQKNNVWDLAIGTEYEANGAWGLSLEILNQHVLSENKDYTQIVGRWRKNWFNETLSTIIFGSYQFQYGDSVASLSASYSIDDDWNAGLVATFFESSDKQSPGQITKDWDQITASVSYSY